MENKIKLNQITNKGFIRYTQKEVGITLVALIITIVIMVIIAVISITIVYNSKIVEYAINGTYNYAGEGIKENKVLEGTESLIDSAIDNLKKINGENISSIEPTPPEPTGLTREELSQETMIGKYVDYKPVGTDYIVNGTYSGTGSNQTFAKNDNMKWRIWGVEENKLLLISETATGNIQFKGANGYNNAVKILNDACSTAFGNSSYESAIKVRSINQDDIDKVCNTTTDEQRKLAFSGYGTTPISKYTNWPNIYAQEPGKSGGGNLDRSSQSSWITGMTNSSFTGRLTYYSYDITNYAIQTMYDALLTNMSVNSTNGTDSHTTYWVASRCTAFYDGGSCTTFHIHRILNGGTAAAGLCRADGFSEPHTHAIRPFMEINLDSLNIGTTGDGTDTDPYSMGLK